MKYILLLITSLTIFSCSTTSEKKEAKDQTEEIQKDTAEFKISPKYITEKVRFDTDDPAVWINYSNPEESLIIGTDKGDDNELGGLYVFNLRGEIDHEKSIKDLQRPNNVDIAYGFAHGEDTIDIAVFTERYTNSIRVFKLPELEPIDADGIPVFKDDSLRSPMGVALYKRQEDNQIFAIVSRKEGDTAQYLEQHALFSEDGIAKGTLSRKFGQWSGEKEIEAIAVDDELGYIYYSDERKAVRKYHADPKKGDEEIHHFATQNFLEDREGISIYSTTDSTGYILVSDQADNTFHVFEREGSNRFLAELPFSTLESDGNESSNFNFNEDFPEGIFVAMSDDATFHIYDWRDIKSALKDSLESAEEK